MAGRPADAKFDAPFRREPATIRDRMHLFYEHAVPLAVDVSKACPGRPAIVRRSGCWCWPPAGFIAPGVDAAIAKELSGLSCR